MTTLRPMPPEQTPTLNQPCTCAEVIGDSDVDKLHRLMGAGMEQRPASLLLWGPGADWRRAMRDTFRARWQGLVLPEDAADLAGGAA
jgi:hypothetical protein